MEYMLAARTAREDGGGRGVVMMRIASLTVALGIAVMILALAVFNGFRSEIESDFRGFAADIVIQDISGWGKSEAEAVRRDAQLEQRVAALEQVQSIAPYVEAGCMVKSEERVVGLKLKGVGCEYDTSWWASKLRQGALPDFSASSRQKQLLLSQTTADALDVGVGEKIELLYVDGEQTPRRDSFRVAGIYSTGMEEMDRTIALADMRDVCRLASLESEQVSGYDVMLRAERLSEGEQVALQIDDLISALSDESDLVSALALTIQMRYPTVFDWLKAHIVIANTVILIMMVVLLFNMAAAMLIMVFDRIAMIGALKALGMRNSAIGRIFLYRAAMLFLRGAAWGNLVGVTIVGVQALWHPIKLDPDGYMLSVLPVDLSLGWILGLNLMALVVTVVVMILPSMMVARLKVEQSLRYKL